MHAAYAVHPCNAVLWFESAGWLAGLGDLLLTVAAGRYWCPGLLDPFPNHVLGCPNPLCVCLWLCCCLQELQVKTADVIMQAQLVAVREVRELAACMFCLAAVHKVCRLAARMVCRKEYGFGASLQHAA
jgi:hypothetical protein